jgi:hypothetical protein
MRRRTWTYLYDQQGRVVQVEADDEWDDDDRAILAALIQYEATLCGDCKQPKDLAWNDILNNEGQSHTGEWELVPVAECVACGAWIDHAKEQAKAKDGSGQDNRFKYATRHSPPDMPPAPPPV